MAPDRSRFHEGPLLRRLAYLGARHGPGFWVRHAPGPIGVAFALLLPESRRRVAENLAWVQGGRPEDVAARDLFGTFAEYAACLAEGLASERREAESAVMEVLGEDRLARALGSERGAVLVTAHVGPWDAAAQLLARKLDRDVAVVMHEEPSARARAFHDLVRSDRGLKVFSVGSGPLDGLPILRHLRAGGVAAFQIDRRAASGRGFDVPFLGRRLAVPEGPFRLASLARVPLVAVFAFRTGFFAYGIEVGEPIELAEGASGEELERAAGRVASAFEGFVRRRPTQWFHFADG